MTAVTMQCPDCGGTGKRAPNARAIWPLCARCSGVGRTWIPGAPSFGCDVTLADRDPGEIVTLGNDDRGRILWHMPRKTKKVRPETTFVGLIGMFDDIESHTPTAYPSSIGVASVDVSRRTVDHDAHAGEREIDYNDPVHRQIAGRLL